MSGTRKSYKIYKDIQSNDPANGLDSVFTVSDSSLNATREHKLSVANNDSFVMMESKTYIDTTTGLDGTNNIAAETKIVLPTVPVSGWRCTVANKGPLFSGTAATTLSLVSFSGTTAVFKNSSSDTAVSLAADCKLLFGDGQVLTLSNTGQSVPAAATAQDITTLANTNFDSSSAVASGVVYTFTVTGGGTATHKYTIVGSTDYQIRSAGTANAAATSVSINPISYDGLNGDKAFVSKITYDGTQYVVS